MPSFKLQVCAVRLINPLKSMQRIKSVERNVKATSLQRVIAATDW